MGASIRASPRHCVLSPLYGSGRCTCYCRYCHPTHAYCRSYSAVTHATAVILAAAHATAATASTHAAALAAITHILLLLLWLLMLLPLLPCASATAVTHFRYCRCCHRYVADDLGASAALRGAVRDATCVVVAGTERLGAADADAFVMSCLLQARADRK